MYTLLDYNKIQECVWNVVDNDFYKSYINAYIMDVR